MKHLIIYDLDGTLVDTSQDILRAAHHMLHQMKAPLLAGDEIRRLVGKGLFHLVKGCLKTDDPKQIEKGAKIYRSFYGEHMLDHSRLYPGALEILDYFKSRKQAVMTNKPDPFSSEILKALGIAHYFTAILAGDSAHPKKPDPSAIFWLMKEWSVKPEEALFIGDSTMDFQTGSNAGVEVALVSHGFASEDELKSAQPCLLAPNFHELLKAIKQKRW